MSNTDFFDEDLAEHRNGRHRSRPEAADGLAAGANTDQPMPARVISDLNLTRMARHKEEVGSQVAGAAEELERLRQRQQQLEREKRTLEEVRRRQDDYEQSKREMIDHLNRTLLVLEKDEVRTGQMLDLLGATRQRFRSMLDEIKGIDEESWNQEQFSEELGKALARLEDMRMEFKKSMARVQAVGEEPAAGAERAPVFDETGGYAGPAGWNFTWWLKAGLAFSLPLVAGGLLLTLLVALLRHLAWF